MFFMREIRLLPGQTPAVFDYSSDVHPACDCGIALYSAYKISVLLTDGLAAVIGDRVYDSVRGDVMLFRPEEIHFGRFLRPGIHRYLDFFIPTDFFAPFTADFESLMRPFRDETPERVNLINPDEAPRAEVLRLAEGLAEIATSPVEGAQADAAFFGKMLELLAICRDLYDEQKRRPFNTSVPSVVLAVLRCLNERYAERINLDDLAAGIGCSVSYLTRTFRLHTGKTIHEYLTERRLECAKRLLADGLSVTEACYGSGFGDCSGFIKVFSRQVGMTPKAYKLSCQGARKMV